MHAPCRPFSSACLPQPEAAALKVRFFLQHYAERCFAMQQRSCLYGHHKYTQSLPHFVLARGRDEGGSGGVMIKTRPCLPDLEQPEK